MSLQAAAQHLSSKGRGPDNTLVHMSRDEVKSLNDLAMAHGGHLTVNPHTGLPEAGFLSAILPTLAGAALAATGIGAPAAALLVGGGMSVATGSLKKGLMAGLGAYGGAGLGSSLLGSAGEAVNTVTPLAEGPAEYVPPARPLEGLDMSGRTTAGLPSPASAAAEAAAPPVASPTGALPADMQAKVLGSPTFSNVTTTTPAIPPAQSMEGAAAAAPVPTEDYSKYADIRGMSAEPANVNVNYGTAPSFTDNMKSMWNNTSTDSLMDWAKNNKMSALGIGASVYSGMQSDKPQASLPTSDADMGQRYSYSANQVQPTPAAGLNGREQRYFNPTYTRLSAADAKNLYGYAGGGPVEQMANANAIGQNTGYPQANLHQGAYATPWQTPVSQNVLSGPADTNVDPYTGEEKFASGGISDAAYNLGGYSDGGRLLRGPGDGVSDSIPATIGHKQPARLADGEFVVPARIVSELGNGSTEAGARKLYAMLDRVQAARGSTVGKGKVAKNSRADKYLPA